MHEWTAGTNTYQLPFLCTTETKLKVFRFKFLHRRIATNDFLLKIGKELGNRLMLFLNWFQRHLHISDCRSSQIFWNNVSQWTSKILIWETSLPTHQLFASAWLTIVHIARHYVYIYLQTTKYLCYAANVHSASCTLHGKWETDCFR